MDENKEYKTENSDKDMRENKKKWVQKSIMKVSGNCYEVDYLMAKIIKPIFDEIDTEILQKY